MRSVPIPLSLQSPMLRRQLIPKVQRTSSQTLSRRYHPKPSLLLGHGAYVHIYADTCTHAYIYICMYVCMYVCIHIPISSNHHIHTRIIPPKRKQLHSLNPKETLAHIVGFKRQGLLFQKHQRQYHNCFNTIKQYLN